MQIRESLREFAKTAPPLTADQQAVIRAAFTPPKPQPKPAKRAA